MKHLKRFNESYPNNSGSKKTHKTIIKEVCEVKLPDPQHGDLKLSVFPFENNGEWIELPEGFKMWEESLNKIASMIPQQEGANTHYVTIDTKFFTNNDFLRREGVHADGNFCVDPKFSFGLNEERRSWGGVGPRTSWGGASPRFEEPTKREVRNDRIEKAKKGIEKYEKDEDSKKNEIFDFENYKALEDNSHVDMDWVLPYDIVIPVGEYMTHKKGGILCVSTEVGCQGWQGEFVGEVLSEGAYDDMKDQLTEDKKVVFEKDKLYFMTSNTPHETLMVEKGNRRTFMRITLNHEYLNENLISKL